MLATLGAAPASAHDQSFQVGDCCRIYGYVYVKNNHTRVEVCDYRADNIVVRVEFYYRLPGQFDDVFDYRNDTNGSKSGCGVWTAPAGARLVLLRGRTGDGWVTEWKTP
jgi:hypothetical protein